jgi:hypothetical protein
MASSSRRGFLHSSLGVAAGSALTGALPTFAMAQVQAADESTGKTKVVIETTKKAAPSERLREPR